jgi:spermidine synthase
LRVVRRLGVLELRLDGALASSLQPGRATTHPVWEALAGSILALEAGRRHSILLLGVGGGAAAHVARALAPSARIVGVEHDPAVAETALSHFGLEALGVELVVDDARRFLQNDRGRYDAILEDVFVGSSRSVRKPDWLPEPGVTLALSRLSAAGLLACNTIHEGPAMRRALLRHTPRLVSIAVSGFHNRILVTGAPTLSAASVRRALAANPRLRRTLPKLALRTLRR